MTKYKKFSILKVKYFSNDRKKDNYFLFFLYSKCPNSPLFINVLLLLYITINVDIHNIISQA